MNTKIYEMVNAKILEQLDNGIIPWEKPWTGTGYSFNRVSNKPYSLLNQMCLTHVGEYASLKQWNQIGGSIKKGSRAEKVVFWKPIIKIEGAEGEEAKEVCKGFVLRYYNVFHISQVDGVEPLETEENPVHVFDPIKAAEDIGYNYIANEGIGFSQEQSNRACYIPGMDKIALPEMTQFVNAAEYYSTLFHEMTHSTGASKRLNRIKSARYGSPDYAAEELVAEIGASYLLHHLGIETDHSTRNNAAYIGSWKTVLKDNPTIFVDAASKAEKAVEYILKAAGAPAA